MFVAHFWSRLLAIRLTKGVDRRAILHEVVSSSVMFVPAVVLLVVAPLAYLVAGSMEVAVTAAMVGPHRGPVRLHLVVGTRAFMGSLGTAAVGLLMTRVQGRGLMRLVVAECQVDYVGRLSAHLPMARRLLLIKADGSVSVHADDRAYKPLNWMSPPCALAEESPTTSTRCGR